MVALDVATRAKAIKSTPLSNTKVQSRIQVAAKKAGRSYISVWFEIMRLFIGPGRLSLEEYLDMSLFDSRSYRSADKHAFVGERAARVIWLKANHRVDLFALATNKIASAIWFAAHGLPILPTLTIFHEGVGRSTSRFMRDEDELRAFLRTTNNYPWFGKPIEGCQSIGSASMAGFDTQRDCLVSTTGECVSLERFIAHVKAHASSGYQFQARVNPHTEVHKICGDRLATVRLLTVLRNGKAEVVRACWKIPVGANAADNFWRPGNLLAQLDEKGHVLRAIRRGSFGMEDVFDHPDTGAHLIGLQVPNWNAVTQLARESAVLLRDLPLVGWDIAPVDSGAVLVEANVTPDLRLHQFADRKGLLDGELRNFLRCRDLVRRSVRSNNKRILANDRWQPLKSIFLDAALAAAAGFRGLWPVQ